MLKAMMTLVSLGSLVAATLAGCASSKSPSASATTGPADVNGTWTGSTQTGNRTVTLQLQQSGTKVTGMLSGTSSPRDGAVTGIVEGNVIKLEGGFGGTTPWLNVKGDMITGDLGSGNIVNLRRVR